MSPSKCTDARFIFIVIVLTNAAAEKTLDRKRSITAAFDLASFGILLIVVGYVWSQHPGLPSRTLAFLRSMGDYKGLPPYSAYPGIYDAFILCVYLLGAWNILLAVIKIPLGAGNYSALSSAVGGVFLFALGYFTREYIMGRLTATTIVAFLLIIAGLFVIVSALVHEALRPRHH
jgi:predicted acyltransferase